MHCPTTSYTNLQVINNAQRAPQAAADALWAIRAILAQECELLRSTQHVVAVYSVSANAMRHALVAV